MTGWSTACCAPAWAGADGSVRVCERLRMRREAHLVENDVDLDGRWGSEYVYAMLEDEFRAAST